MINRSNNIKGKRFGRLIAEKPTGERSGRDVMWVCRCDCGGYYLGKASSLRFGRVRSCGCLYRDSRKTASRTHGFSCLYDSSGMPQRERCSFYARFQKLRRRCINRSDPSFKDYGGRGIKCLWRTFEEFRDDMWESYLEHVIRHGRKNTHIDRIDNNGNYCKENCRWATLEENNNNKRNNVQVTIDGKTLSLAQWARRLGVNYGTMRSWKNKDGLSPQEVVEKAIRSSLPLNRGRPKNN